MKQFGKQQMTQFMGYDQQGDTIYFVIIIFCTYFLFQTAFTIGWVQLRNALAFTRI